uniref:Reverse transcriptase zinc-binding domain-containing protein n=1 Tax=Quercus lobata TaxID=97700 RepID=A0A7N2RFA1_QUELO
MMWLHTARGVYSVKSGYYVATQVLRGADWTESSRGVCGSKVWTMLWKLKVPNKIKVFGWRVCQNILPTRDNLVHRRIIDDDTCELCKSTSETVIHALWECGVARDVWASSLVKRQKCAGGQQDSMQLFEEMQGRLTREELELFLVQAWLIWSQRNRISHGGKLQSPTQLNKRAFDLLTEFRQAQEQLTIASRTSTVSRWCPPPNSRFKLNFDAAIFPDLKCSGIGAIIRNERGEVMGAMSAKEQQVLDSTEAEVLACRRALEFAIDIGFSELVIEGDSAQVLNSLRSTATNLSRLGHIFDDIQCLMAGLLWVEVKLVSRNANGAPHSLARYAKNIVEDVVWLEDSPPPALEALYVDSLQS